MSYRFMWGYRGLFLLNSHFLYVCNTPLRSSSLSSPIPSTMLMRPYPYTTPILPLYSSHPLFSPPRLTPSSPPRLPLVSPSSPPCYPLSDRVTEYHSTKRQNVQLLTLLHSYPPTLLPSYLPKELYAFVFPLTQGKNTN